VLIRLFRSVRDRQVVPQLVCFDEACVVTRRGEFLERWGFECRGSETVFLLHEEDVGV
jgi:hypothetical protein